MDREMKYPYSQFIKDMEKIFKYTKGPKLVMCTRCGDTVNSAKDSDCSCGYLGKVFKQVLDKSRESDG